MIGGQAALFAGFLSSFLIELLARLEPDAMDIIQDVLIYQTQMMRNSSLEPYVPADFSPPQHIVVVNALFYASLGVMLLAAFIAMLIKSWVREFDRGLQAMSPPERRAKTREFRFLGMERWKLPEIVAMLPLLIQISLVLFFIGLIVFLFHISKPAFGITTAIFGIGILYYAITTSISVLVTSSPFRSPLSRTLGTMYLRIYRRAHAYFCLDISHFEYPAMDITPATALGRVHRAIEIFLQKSRPYLEKDFQVPIVKATTDEVQLSTVASAMWRIHDSGPYSQHSEALQRSVWWVEGTAAINTSPSLNVPDWILWKLDDDEYLSGLPPAMLVALLAIWLRGPGKTHVKHITVFWNLFQRITVVRDLLRRMEISNVPWARVVVAVFDYFIDGFLLHDHFIDRFRLLDLDDCIERRQATSNLTNVARRKRIPREESLWLLSTLSELRIGQWQLEREPFLIGICLATLLNHAPEWDDDYTTDIVILEAVVTLAAMSCSLDDVNRLDILIRSREHSYLFLNARNPALFANWFEDIPSDYHKQFISLLFLVVYAFICRGSYHLAVQYFTVTTAKGGLSLYTSALTAIAPAMGNSGLSAIGRMIVAPQTQELTRVIRDSTRYGAHTFLEEMLKNYDLQLGASENPDPNFLAILFMLSKHVHSGKLEELKNVNLELKNPWSRLAARVVARLDIPDGSGLPMGSFGDHRVHNMIAALSLLRYTQGTVHQYTEFLFLGSFLKSREISISSVALEYYMKTTMSYPDPPAPPYCLSTVVSAVFNFILPDHHLWMGWTILHIFVDGFETLSVEWRRSFAEGFFTLSCRPLVTPRGDRESITRENELEQILTWEYFNEEGQKPELTDSEFSGLDWMAMAWSLHLSQQLGGKSEGSGQGKSKLQNLSGPAVNEEFVLRAFCKLLDAVPPFQLIPITPKICEFSQWFDDTELPEYRRTISTRIREAVRMHQEFENLHRFHKFHCMWYI